MNCKNIECGNLVIGNRLYCSYSCRNVYTNKYLRDYNKISKSFDEKRNKKEKEYKKNPKFCKKCGDELSYDKRENKYCSHSCSASDNNSHREYYWNESISDGIHKFLVNSGIRNENERNGYELVCKECTNIFHHNKRKTKFCSKLCRNINKRINMDEYKKYKQDCLFKFSLNDYVDEFDFSLIEENGWYSPSNKKNNLNGVSRDHMYSVREGFNNKIDHYYISHPANCILMLHSENISKNKKCSITFDELLERIRQFEVKYGAYLKK